MSCDNSEVSMDRAEKTDTLIKKSRGIRFCAECNNMLYPKEDKRDGGCLIYVCRLCTYTEEAESVCIYSNKISHDVDEMAHIPSEVVCDPALPRTNTHECPRCEERDAVFFQGECSNAERSMRLYFVCCHCQMKWRE